MENFMREPQSEYVIAINDKCNSTTIAECASRSGIVALMLQADGATFILATFTRAYRDSIFRIVIRF